MNIAGLNNLAFAQKPQTAAKGGPSKKDSKEMSFDDVLGQKEQSAAKPETPVKEKAERAPVQSRFNGLGEKKNSFKPASEDRSNRTEDETSNARANREKEHPSHEGMEASDAGSEAAGLDPNTLPGQNLSAGLGNPALNDRIGTPQPLSLGQMAAKSPVTKEENGVDSLTRRVVWNDFLRKMKEDLGISAEDVLHAFGSLSDEDLAKPPAETVDKVVMALGLNDQQALLAKQYFQELIQKTQSRSIGEELQTSGKQISLTLMSERELQRKAMERRLEQMNSTFFMTGANARPAAPQMPQALSAQAQPVSMAGDSPEGKNAITDGSSLAALTAALNGSAPSAAANPAAPVVQSAPATAQAGKSPVDELTAQMQPVSDDKDRSVDQLINKFINGQNPSALAKAKMNLAAEAAAADTAAKAGSAATAAAPSAPAMSAASLNGLLAALGDGDESSSEEGGDSLDASYLNMPIATGDSKLNSAMQTGSDFKAQLAQVNPGQPMAVPDLVQHAQVMVRDGGGDMKVTLTPDGLGEVAMKVSVENGKVNVQMITESDEAKKLIERQLGELKTSLTHHNLQVMDIKVDTASNLGKQLEQQYQDAQRQLTQQSWEQFRQDNQGWRRSFFDMPSTRAYKGQADAPRDIEAPSRASSRRVGQRRLDLVA